MHTVGIDELKRRLSELVRLVERGDEVVVTRHNRPVVQMTQVQTVHLHQGDRFGKAELEPALQKSSQGAYLDVLKEDRQGGRRA